MCKQAASRGKKQAGRSFLCPCTCLLQRWRPWLFQPASERHVSGTWRGQPAEGDWWEPRVRLCLRCCSWELWSVCQLCMYAGCAFLCVDYTLIKSFRSVYSLVTLLCVVGKQGTQSKSPQSKLCHSYMTEDHQTIRNTEVEIKELI